MHPLTVVFRCDSSSRIGSGHIFRCRNLARKLKKYGSRVVFLCVSQDGDFNQVLNSEFEVLVFRKQDQCYANGDQTTLTYSSLLGCSQKYDAELCITALEEASIFHIDWFVVDHYALDSEWELAVLNHFKSHAVSKLLAIDDLANRRHSSDILVDSNYYGAITEFRYNTLVPDTCLQLLGPAYALLSPEYSILREFCFPRLNLQRVLISFGGFDQLQYTDKVLEIFSRPNLRDISLDVVIARNSLNYPIVQKICSMRPNTLLHSNLPSLAGLMIRADLAIGASGTTSWERLCLGLPSIVYPTASNQLLLSKCLSEEKVIYTPTNKDGTFDPLYQFLSSGGVQNLFDSFLKSDLPDIVTGQGPELVVESIVNF